MIKPIETLYDGYRFRSRLEARWAVFFNALGVRYEYEPEGFDLDGTAYLPDFRLPEQDCWIEIKPADPTDEERAKLYLLAEHTQKSAFFMYGSPGTFEVDYWMRGYKAIPREGYCYIDIWDDGVGRCGWCFCAHCGQIGITRNALASGLPCGGCFEKRKEQSKKPEIDWSAPGVYLAGTRWTSQVPLTFNRIQRAELQARQARFEHGERG